MNELDNDASESYTSDASESYTSDASSCTCDQNESDFQMWIDENNGFNSTTATNGIQELAEDEPSRLLGRSLKSLLRALLNWQSQSGVSATALDSLLAIISTCLCTLATLLPGLKPLSEAFPSSVARASAVVGIKQSVICMPSVSLLVGTARLFSKRRVPSTCEFVGILSNSTDVPAVKVC